MFLDYFEKNNDFKMFYQ